jgi:hypothetical protein
MGHVVTPVSRSSRRQLLLVSIGILGVWVLASGPVALAPCAVIRHSSGSRAGLYHRHDSYPVHTIVLGGLGDFEYRWWGCYTTFDPITTGFGLVGQGGAYQIETDGLVRFQSWSPWQWTIGQYPHTFRIVDWGAREYLVPENDGPESGFETLCNAINAGNEPRDHNGGLEKIYLRHGDWEKPVSGKPKMPLRWTQRLLPNPIVGTLISVGGREGIASLNPINDCWVGMELFDLNAQWPLFPIGRIKAIGTRQCVIQLQPPQLPLAGTKLSSIPRRRP